MQQHQVLVGKSAEREICKLIPQVQQQIADAIEALGSDPRPPNSEKLKANPQFRRVRVGNFRVIYAIRNPSTVLVLVVRDRKDAFRGLEEIDMKLAHALKQFASVMLSEATIQGRA